MPVQISSNVLGRFHRQGQQWSTAALGRGNQGPLIWNEPQVVLARKVAILDMVGLPFSGRAALIGWSGSADGVKPCWPKNPLAKLVVVETASDPCLGAACFMASPRIVPPIPSLDSGMHPGSR